MKKLFLFLAALFATTVMNIRAEVLLNESFNYALGDLAYGEYKDMGTDQSKWWYMTGSTDIRVVDTNLTKAGYQSTPSGKAVKMQAANKRDIRAFNGVSGNGKSVYYSFLLNVDTMKTQTSKVYMCGLSGTSSASGAAAIYGEVRLTYKVPSSYQIGITKANEVGVRYAPSAIPFDSTILVVVRYDFVDGEKNDECYLWINPTKLDEGKPTTQCVQDTVSGSGTAWGANQKVDPSALSIINLTGSSYFIGTFIDEVRVATKWADLFEEPMMSFDADTVNKDIMDAPFINPLTTTAGVGDTTYTSSDTTVATVDANGQVTVLSGGTTIITASVAETATYAAKSVSYVLNVTFIPQEGTFWKETFSKVPAVKNYMGTDKYVGDSSVYNWTMNKYQRQTDDSVGNYMGTRIRYSGSLAMDSVQEGGIKAVRFDYRAANQVNPIHFIVKMNGVDYDYKHAALPVKGTIITYAKKFEVMKNVQFSINVNAAETPSQGYPIIGPITITPYLLYTTKSAEATDKYTNTDLINNTPDTATIVYTLEDNDGEASINASTGEVTCLAEGEVTVRATWGLVSTTYTLTTHINPIVETYGRKLKESGQYGTICLAKKFTSMEGVAGLYVPSYKDTTTLYCREVSVSDVVAGGAYIFKAEAGKDTVTFVLDGEAVSAAVNNDHMIGWLSADYTLTAESDYYGLNGNTIIKLAADSTIKQNHAMIDLDNVSTGTPAPGRKYVSFGINAPTGVVDVNANANANRKMMINNQLIIMKDGKMYNAMGAQL